MAATRQMMGSARMLRAARPSLYATPAYVSSSASASASCSAQQHRNGRAAGCSSNSSSSSSFCTSARASGPWSYSGKSNKPLHRYLVIAEDYPDPGALARRLEVRERHLEGAAEGIESGLIGESSNLSLNCQADCSDMEPLQSSVEVSSSATLTKSTKKSARHPA